MKPFPLTRLFAVVVAALSLSAVTARAAQVTLTGDASVSTARPTTNFGLLSNLYVGNGNTAFLQFDLSQLPAGITSTQVSKATLTLFVNRVNTAGTVNVSQVNSAWTESGAGGITSEPMRFHLEDPQFFPDVTPPP